MKHKVIVGLLETVMISTSVSLLTSNQVNAASFNSKVGQVVKLKRNSYVYNSKGNRVSAPTIKRGHSFKIKKIVTIKGKKYIQIGSNKYIKLVNFSVKKASIKKSTLSKNAYIYNKNGKRVKHVTLKRGSKINNLGTVVIKGKKYICIGKNQYVKSANVALKTIVPTFEKKTPVTENKDNISTKVKINNSTVSNSSTSNVNNKNDNSEKIAAEPRVGETLTLKHTSYVYDKNGKKYLGVLVNKGSRFSISAIVTINGQKYAHIDYDEEYVDPYVPLSAFEKDGPEFVYPTPASDEDFDKLEQFLNDSRTQYRKKYDDDMSSAFEIAINTGYRVENFKYSTSDDIAQAEAMITDALSKEKDNRVVVYINEPFTTAQKQAIAQLANEKYRVSNARVSANDKKVIFTRGDRRYTVPVEAFVKYESDSSKPETMVGKVLKIKHASYLLDENGQHAIPVVFFSKGAQVAINGYKVINGVKCYEVWYPNCYIPVSKFSDEGTDESVITASSTEKAAAHALYEKYEDMQHVGNKYYLATYSLRKKFDKALNNINENNLFVYGTNDDLKRAEDNLSTAYNNLDGHKIKINHSYKEPLTESEKFAILSQVNKVEGSSDAALSGEGSVTYTSPDFDMIMHDTMDKYVDYKN